MAVLIEVCEKHLYRALSIRVSLIVKFLHSITCHDW